MKNNEIKVPYFLTKIFISEVINNENIKINNLTFQFPNNLKIERGNYQFENAKFFFQNASLKFLFKFDTFEIVNFHLDQLDYNEYGINDLKIKKDLTSYNASFSVNSELFEISSIGSIASDNLESFKNCIELLKVLKTKFKEIKIPSKSEKKISKAKLRCFFSLNNHNTIYLNQIDEKNNNYLIKNLNFATQFSSSRNFNNKVLLSVDTLNLSTNKNHLKFNKCNFEILNLINLNYINMSFKSINIKNQFIGIIPNLKVCIRLKDNKSTISLFSDSNSTKFTNKLNYENLDLISISGINQFRPNLLDLDINAYKSCYNFINGNFLEVKFHNPFNQQTDKKGLMKIRAEQLSVLESPFGDYDLFGFFDKNYTLFLKEIICDINDNIVTGSYYQSWNPYNFEFRVDGLLSPSDINNWLGDWWDNIWNDFNFSETDIPYGNFVVKGKWGNTSKTEAFGLIDCQNFFYKDSLIKDTVIILSRDDNELTLKSNQILHSEGNLNGVISISKKSNLPANYLKFNAHGNLPINNYKRVLGQHIENYLEDINISSITIDASGNFPLSPILLDTNLTEKPYFTLDLSSENNGSYKGLEFSKIKGGIKSDFSNIYFKFPSINFANGILNIDLNFNSLNKNINFNSNLSNASIKKVFQSYRNFKRQQEISFSDISEFSSISDKGIINLTLNANGSSENIYGFKGTGKMKLIDKSLSKIQLLGFLSRGLSELPIPLPTGTLNFNSIEGLFELDNNYINFDQLTLTGLFSKIISKGHFNFLNNEIDIISKIYLLGNIPVPILKQLVKITDPLSSIAEVNLTGTLSKPNWKILIKPIK